MHYTVQWTIFCFISYNVLGKSNSTTQPNSSFAWAVSWRSWTVSWLFLLKRTKGLLINTINGKCWDSVLSSETHAELALWSHCLGLEVIKVMQISFELSMSIINSKWGVKFDYSGAKSGMLSKWDLVASSTYDCEIVSWGPSFSLCVRTFHFSRQGHKDPSQEMAPILGQVGSWTKTMSPFHLGYIIKMWWGRN